MKSFSLIASASLLACLASAAPFEKRDVIVTKTQVDVVVIPVTSTIWAGQEETAEPTSSAVPVIGQEKAVVNQPQGPPATQAAPAVVQSAPAPPPAAAPVVPTTTSVAVASAPTTTSNPPAAVPTTTTVPVAPTTAAAAPVVSTTSVAAAAAAAPAYTASSGNSGSTASGSSQQGQGTFYDTGLGSCGVTSTQSDLIVAISHTTFDPYTPGGNPNKNPLCGRTVTIQTATGGTVQAKVVDRCERCVPGDLDMSDALALIVNPDAKNEQATAAAGYPANRLNGRWAISWQWD